MTEQLWRGEFGDSYTLRNADAGRDRGRFWQALLDRHEVGNVLEAGCNVGANLRWIPAHRRSVAGCDINDHALRLAEERLKYRVTFLKHSLLDLGALRDMAAWDLVFTCGVLIHISPDDVGRAIDELVAASRRLVLLIEYYAETETLVRYRGQEAALWKRPFDELVRDRHPELRLVEWGDLTKADGFDECRFWVFLKRLEAA